MTTIQTSEPTVSTETTANRPIRYVRRVVGTLVGLLTLLAVPTSAFAWVGPTRPDGTPPPAGTDVVAQGSSAEPASSSWGLTSAVGLAVIAVLAVAVFLVVRRISRQRRVPRRLANA